MEIINKKHEAITVKKKLRLEPFFKVVDYRSLLFSAGAVINFGLAAGLYVHMINDEFKWTFFCNNDPDGFLISMASGKRGRQAVMVNNAALVKLIQNRTRVSIGSKFPIKATTAKFNGHHLLEIDFHKPYELSPAAIKNNNKKITFIPHKITA